MDELLKILVDVQRDYSQSNKVKDKIIIILIIITFLEAVVGYGGFVWYESQFDTIETQTEVEEVKTRTTEDANVSSEGENASAEYNNVDGNQYNDNATHNEGGNK